MKEGFIIKTVPKPKLLPDYFGMYSFDRLTKFENNFIVSGHEIKKLKTQSFIYLILISKTKENLAFYLRMQ